MRFTASQAFFGIAGFALYLAILWVGYRHRLLRAFPVFYLYVSARVLQSIWFWSYLLFLGESRDPIYAHSFYANLLADQLFEVAIMAKIYLRVKTSKDNWYWGLLVFLTAMMALVSLSHELSDIFSGYLAGNAVLYQFQVLFCALILGHMALNRRVAIGWNQFSIISGLAISILLKYIGWALVASRVFGYDALQPWFQPLELLPWVFWAFLIRGPASDGSLPDGHADDSRTPAPRI